jgi:endoplasmic reticulum chaperone BiP
MLRYEQNEDYVKEKAKIRNDFESTLYALKDDFENPGLKTFSSEDEMNKLKDSVAEELTWLEDNAWTAEKDEFESHFRTIQDVYLPIVNRSNEYRDR